MHHLAAALVSSMLLLQAQRPSAPVSSSASAQLSQAESRYRSAIELNPGVAAYHESLARVLERQGRNAEALVEHRRSATLDSLAARNREGYGSLLLRMGKPNEAIPELRAAARLDPVSVDVRKQLATALLNVGEKDEAASVLREARTLAPNDSSVTRMLAAATTASAAQRAGYHDYSDFEGSEHTVAWMGQRVLRVVFGAVLAIAAIALVAPIVGTLILLLVRLPYERLRGYATARVNAH